MKRAIRVQPGGGGGRRGDYSGGSGGGLLLTARAILPFYRLLRILASLTFVHGWFDHHVLHVKLYPRTCD